MNRFLVFIFMMLAPVLVFVLIISPLSGSRQIELIINNNRPLEKSVLDVDLKINEMDSIIFDVRESVSSLVDNYNNINNRYLSIINGANYSLEKVKNQSKLSTDIYEEKILSILGQPIYSHESINNQLKIFELKELGYRGHMAKIKLYNPKSLKLVLAEDRPGGFETTSSMAESKGALLAVNAGGFGTFISEGRTYTSMVGATVVDGEFIQEFVKTEEEISFVGIDSLGEFIGISPEDNDQIEALNPYQGASFIPSLIVDFEKTPIPLAWKVAKHPRTIIGKYPNGDILLIVIDGRNDEWSSGISLEMAQEKLLLLGIEEAYNLDGGGSSSLYYDGKLLNKPSDGFERKVANSFILLP